MRAPEPEPEPERDDERPGSETFGSQGVYCGPGEHVTIGGQAIGGQVSGGYTPRLPRIDHDVAGGSSGVGVLRRPDQHHGFGHQWLSRVLRRPGQHL